MDRVSKIGKKFMDRVPYHNIISFTIFARGGVYGDTELITASLLLFGVCLLKRPMS